MRLRIVYVSSASRYFAEPEIQAMLNRARFKNAKIGVTGVLLYKDGNILQALEGEEEVVAKLASTIESDSRHSGFLVLMRGTVERRLFPESPMGLRDLAAEPLTSTPSDTDFILFSVNSVLLSPRTLC